MNLNKMFVFIFVFFIMFAALLAYMPEDFTILGIEAEVQDKEVREYFNEHDITMYNYTVSINLTHASPEQRDFGLPEGQKLEFMWDYHLLELRHLTDNFWGWWWGWHPLQILEPYATMANVEGYPRLNKEQLLLLWNEGYNASYCEFACDHISVKLFVITYNQSWTLSESWDNDKLKLYTTYEIDWSATGTSMWHIMMQLLAFQNPNLGIPGVGGTILTAGVGGTLWACIALLAFSFITSVIPFIRGWVGGGG